MIKSVFILQCLWKGWNRKKQCILLISWIDYTFNTNISDHVGSEHFWFFYSNIFLCSLQIFVYIMITKINSGSVAPAQHKAAVKTGELSLWSANYQCSLSFGFSAHHGHFGDEINCKMRIITNSFTNVLLCSHHLYKNSRELDYQTNENKYSKISKEKKKL